MKIEVYKEKMCKFCKKNKEFCDLYEIIEENGTIIYRCKEYINNSEKKNSFTYKNQLFFY